MKSGYPWEGLVKNRTKTGDYYWVRANVTPVVDGGELKGFISIRTRPERKEVAAAEAPTRRFAKGVAAACESAAAIVESGPIERWKRITRGIASSFAHKFWDLLRGHGG